MESPILFHISSDEYWQKLSEVMDRILTEKLNQGSRPATPPGMTARPLLTIKEVCDLFQITKPTIYEWARQDEGIPYLADSLNVGEPLCHLADVVSDMKRALKPELCARLVEHSFAYAPPYLPLFRFCDSAPQRSLISLIVKDWEDQTLKDKFTYYITKVYKDLDTSKILNEVTEFIKRFRKET